jgi:hypothetical protein
MWYKIFISGLVLWSCPAMGQVDSHHLLQEAASVIRSMRQYSYETEVSVLYPDGQKDQMQTRLYMDRDQHLLFYETDEEEYLLTPDWAYQAHHRNGTASVFKVKTYNERFKDRPRLDAFFKNIPTEAFLDSVLLRVAKVESAKEHGDTVFLRLAFPDQSYIRNMQLSYNRQARVPVAIRIRTFYPDGRFPAGEDGKTKGVTYDFHCRKYTRTYPSDIFDIHKYFVVRGNRVTLKRHVNYKLVTVL